MVQQGLCLLIWRVQPGLSLEGTTYPIEYNHSGSRASRHHFPACLESEMEMNRQETSAKANTEAFDGVMYTVCWASEEPGWLRSFSGRD